MSKRTGQLASVLRRAVQSVLDEGLADPRLDALITVTEVRVDPSAREAVVLVSVSPERAESKVSHALRDAARHIRRRAADHTALARMPELSFRIDKSIKKQAAVLDALRRVAEERDEAPESDAAARDSRGGNNQPDGPSDEHEPDAPRPGAADGS